MKSGGNQGWGDIQYNLRLSRWSVQPVSDGESDARIVIMVVDDDWMNRELLQTHLERAGYDVVTANNGQKALEIVMSRPPDLVLLDVRMHGLDGYEVCI